MASVHPSRMNLIPQELRDRPQERSRGRSPRRSPSPRQRDQERDRDRRRDDNRRNYDDDRRSGRDRSVDRGRDSHRDRGAEPRRSSPQYEDYKRPPPPANTGEAPWRQQESMYPPHRGGNPYGGSGGSGASFLEARRAQRDAMTANPWPPSPKAPARDLSPRGKKSSKKSKRHRSPSSDETDSSEEERRRRKERKRAKKAREKEERKEKKHHRRHRHHSSDEEDEDEDSKHRTHRSKRSRSRSPSHSRSRSRSKSVRVRSRTASKERMDVDRLRLGSPTPAPSTGVTTSRANSKGPTKMSKNDPNEESSDEEMGPKPLYAKSSGKKTDERAYGGALLRGEGSAMAAFLQEDPSSRIPRRGEIGLTSEEIAKYEDVGYVMSGSRHRRMNAVRMRKENQVISAEEKRGILKLQREERERKEAILRDEFSQLVSEKLKATTGHAQPPT